MHVLDSFRLDGKVGIVTGASSGLGVYFATALAEAGADLLVVARREDLLVENAKKISEQTGRKIIPMRADVCNEQDIVNMVKRAETEFGKIDILVNNAGIAVAGPSNSLTKEDWDRVLAVNLTGLFLCCKHAINSMISKQVSGRIINIASIYGLFGDVLPAAPYYASKGAVVNLTRALAVEYAKSGIRINAIAPGFFPSEMTKDVLSNSEIKAHIEARTPMGRLGNGEELKGAVVFLASDAASYITGCVLSVDGGWTAE